MDNSGDYISRKAAIANSREYNLGGSYDNTERAVPVDAINSIPAADVRPVVRGHWIYKPYKVGRMNINFPSCSECGYSPFVSMYYAVEDMHYCPNCGADMRPEPEEETE